MTTMTPQDWEVLKIFAAAALILWVGLSFTDWFEDEYTEDE